MEEIGNLIESEVIPSRRHKEIVEKHKRSWAKNVFVQDLLNIKEERKQVTLRVGELQNEVKLLQQENAKNYELVENALSCVAPSPSHPLYM